jgi:hypothetical protein
VEDDHSDSDDDDDNGRMEKLHAMKESAQKPQKCIMVAVVNAHRREEGCVTAVEAMITFMEESRDVTDVAFEAEFMTSRSTMNK